MDITVIIYTHNRCQLLSNALENVAKLRLPDSMEWEAIVIDNNSQDKTREVAEDFVRRYPGRFRYLNESRQGKSHALNAAIRAARGKVLAFTEDDVTVEGTWLQNLTQGMTRTDWIGAGGRVVLQWPSSLPTWFSKDGPRPHHGFPGFNPGTEFEELPSSPLGSNMAIRKSVIERIGGFRTDLGLPASADYAITAEETELGWRLISDGKQLRYEGSAVVHYAVPESMIKKDYLLAHAFERGRIEALDKTANVHRAISLVAWTLRWIMSVGASTRFYCKLTVWRKAGRFAELKRQKEETKRKKILKAEAIRRNIAEIKRDHGNSLGLKAGERVEVRTQDEILATLDERGRLGNLPFMPEMLKYCGMQFRVFRRADKTCDNIEPWSIRRMTNTVHLEGLRCEGEAHGGCQAGCTFYWKEAWLKRTTKNVVSSSSLRGDILPPKRVEGVCTIQNILDASERTDSTGETVYSCQATEVLNFTTFMRSWDPRQFIRDLRSGNLSSGLAESSRPHRQLEFLLGVQRIIRTVTLSVFNSIQEKRHPWPQRRHTYPFIDASAKKTPLEILNLQLGELVQVRSNEEIVASLDMQDRNRGLLFDGAMLTHCGGIYRVWRRVNRIIDEKTGKMMDMKYPCIALEGVTCQWDYHRLCPRDTCIPYWREGWLRRATDLPTSLSEEKIAEICKKP